MNDEGRPIPVLQTARLTLRQLHANDAGFVHRLTNDADWLRFIGDRGIRTPADAEAYIRNGPQAMFERLGHGLRLVERRSDAVPLGMCGLLRRDTLEHPDIGYAFLPEFRGYGYAFEAARATLDDARRRLGLQRVLAIVSPDNAASIRLLERLGLAREGVFRLSEDSPPASLYAGDLRDEPSADAEPDQNG